MANAMFPPNNQLNNRPWPTQPMYTYNQPVVPSTTVPMYGQVQQPYIPQQQPTQQVQQQMPPLKGRVVADESEITPNEVTMDGTVSFFPKSDYSCIFAKIWNSDGKISTFKFVPETVEEPTSAEPAETAISEDMNNKLDTIIKLLKSPRNQQYHKPHTKKEHNNES